MPRLDSAFFVLEHNFHKIMKSNINNRDTKHRRSRSWGISEGIDIKNARDFEPISQL